MRLRNGSCILRACRGPVRKVRRDRAHRYECRGDDRSMLHELNSMPRTTRGFSLTCLNAFNIAPVFFDGGMP
jgi:hypothetical protein